jgi:hypothetical protein
MTDFLILPFEYLYFIQPNKKGGRHLPATLEYFIRNVKLDSLQEPHLINLYHYFVDLDRAL